MWSTIKHKLITLLQFILVIIYIVFEEIIWEGISKPIYEFLHSLKILRRVETMLHMVNAYVILMIFVVLLAFVEFLGIYAGILFVQGKVWHGLTLYITKIPIAAFTFWVFRITEDKLMQFGWFNWLYSLMIAAVEWVKSKAVYISMIKKIKIVKKEIKDIMKIFKERYFSKERAFSIKIKKLYKVIKESMDKK